mmetsp:Transcript_97987/g.285859  ORF Transcript_97987/g.285859 Transcript_97987/m.285859 type:complete len:150 (+) Transcript_97987:2-451(+)
MHHAYPRDCRYPHVSGTTNPQQVIEYRAKTGMKAVASKEEMQGFVAAAAPRTRAEEELEDGLCSNMWTMEEELVDPSAHGAHQDALRSRWIPEGTGVLRGVVLFLAVASVAVTLAKTALSASEAGPERDGMAKGLLASALDSRGVTYSV